MSNQLDPDILDQFTGSPKVYRFTKKSPNTLLSEGAAYVAKNGGLWLMDIIASVQEMKKAQTIPYQVWHLTVRDDKSGSIVAQVSTAWVGEFGGDEYRRGTFYNQEIPSTELGIDEIMLYVVSEGDYRIIMLDSENYI